MNSNHVQKINKLIQEIESYYGKSRESIFLEHIKKRLDESLKQYDNDLSECINILSLESQIKLARKLIE